MSLAGAVTKTALCSAIYAYSRLDLRLQLRLQLQQQQQQQRHHTRQLTRLLIRPMSRPLLLLLRAVNMRPGDRESILKYLRRPPLVEESLMLRVLTPRR